MVTRERTLAALLGAATVVALAALSLERHVVRGESMKPTLHPRDTAISVKIRSPLGAALRLARHPRPGDIAVIELPWELDLLPGFSRGLEVGVDGVVVLAGVVATTAGFLLPYVPLVLAGMALLWWLRRRRAEISAPGDRPSPA